MATNNEVVKKKRGRPAKSKSIGAEEKGAEDSFLLALSKPERRRALRGDLNGLLSGEEAPWVRSFSSRSKAQEYLHKIAADQYNHLTRSRAMRAYIYARILDGDREIKGMRVPFNKIPWPNDLDDLADWLRNFIYGFLRGRGLRFSSFSVTVENVGRLSLNGIETNWHYVAWHALRLGYLLGCPWAKRFPPGHPPEPELANRKKRSSLGGLFDGLFGD